MSRQVFFFLVLVLNLVLFADPLSREGLAGSIMRFNGVMSLYNDSYFNAAVSGPEASKSQIKKSLETHYAKFGKFHATSKDKILKTFWDPQTKQGKLVMEADYDKGKDEVILYYEAVPGDMMISVKVRYLAFASQMSEQEADLQVGPLNKKWKTTLRI